MRFACFLLATVVIACSSSHTPGSVRDAAIPAEGGDATPIVKSPGSADGGVSAPCTDSSNCSEGLQCIDGACFG
jgi:hypothetical protein